MKFKRTPETISLNAQLQIMSLEGMKFETHEGTCLFSDWYAFFIPGKGFIKFKDHDLEVPYAPIGGRKALQSIIDDGGFIEYDSLEFVNPID